MALTVDITDFEVRESGEMFKGLMHSVSAKLILKEGEVIVHEQVFTEKHKSIYTVADTMDKIAIQMAKTEKRIGKEIALKAKTEAEKTKMLDKISSLKEVKQNG